MVQLSTEDALAAGGRAGHGAGVGHRRATLIPRELRVNARPPRDNRRPVRESEATGPDELPLIAYRINDAPMPLVPASAAREWMARTSHQFAKRCLPLLLANQAGWMVLNDEPVTVEWDGGDATAGLQVSYEGPPPRLPALSLFGHGILSWHVPYVFRTPPGYNLLVRGPANLPKDGIQALEGIVETDWSNAGFTMNWQLTRRGQPVTFERGEPIVQLVPQRRGELASFLPEIREIDTAPEVARGHLRWHESRQAFLNAQQAGLVRATEWQKDYFRGRLPGGETSTEHEVRLRLRPFEPGPAD